MQNLSRSTRLPGRDRMWFGERSVTLLDGLDAPHPDAFRGTLRQLAEIAPRHRIFRIPNADQGRWVPVGRGRIHAYCDQIVDSFTASAGTDMDGADPDDLARMLYHADMGGFPVRFTFGPSTAALTAAHTLLDGRSGTHLFATLLRAAAERRPPLELATTSTRLPLARSLGLFAARNPSVALGTLRTRRPAPPDPPAGRPTRPWAPAVTTITRHSDAGVLVDLRRWRAQNAPEASSTTVLFAAARAALTSVGLPPRIPGVYTVVDNRRYLPAGARLDGNFSSAVYLDPADPLDPVSVRDAMRGMLGTGLPLVTMGAGAAHAFRSTAAETHAPTTAPAEPRVVLVVNHVGRMTAFEDLPWRDGGAGGAVPGATAPRYIAVSTQGQPEDVTVHLAEMHGRLHVGVASHEGVFDQALLTSVAEALCTDPVGLLKADDNYRLGTSSANRSR